MSLADRLRVMAAVVVTGARQTGSSRSDASDSTVLPMTRGPSGSPRWVFPSSLAGTLPVSRPLWLSRFLNLLGV